jgi:hypothetical protein
MTECRTPCDLLPGESVTLTIDESMHHGQTIIRMMMDNQCTVVLIQRGGITRAIEVTRCEQRVRPLIEIRKT